MKNSSFAPRFKTYALPLLAAIFLAHSSAMAGDPIPGVDVDLPKGADQAKPSAQGQAMPPPAAPGRFGKPPIGPVGPLGTAKPTPQGQALTSGREKIKGAAISDQAAGGVLSSYRKVPAPQNGGPAKAKKETEANSALGQVSTTR